MTDLGDGHVDHGDCDLGDNHVHDQDLLMIE